MKTKSDANLDFNKPYFVILKKPSKYNDIETYFEGSRCKYLFPTLTAINSNNKKTPKERNEKTLFIRK